jgi:anti-anti-sigma factor
MSPIEFRIDLVPEPDGAVRLIVRGEIDIATSQQLHAELETLRARHTPVRLDLSETGFVDSSGLAVLIAAKRQAEQNGWVFALAPEISPAVQRLFALAGVESFILR